MTTTAFDDQFTPSTQTIEPVRQPYDTVAILRRNIADAEKEMQRQAERAESYADALRSLAAYVGAGGYNADAVDAGVFEEKIRWGIGEIMARMENAEAELKEILGWLVTTANNPLPYILGNQYWTKEGELVRFVAVHSAGKDHETMSDEQGVHRYTRRDFGRVTGSCHEYSDSRNTPPLYAAPVPAPHPGATHCDDCGLTWLDDGLNPLGCPYCKDATPAPAVPAEWRAVMAELLANDGADGGRYDANKWLAARDKARALLQSSAQAPAVPAEIIELSKKYAIDTEAYHAAMDALLQSAGATK